MTSSTSTIRAASNGTTTENTDAPHVRGITLARQWQIYHIAGLATSALTEAENLLSQIQKAAAKASNHYCDDSQPAESLDLAHVGDVLNETLDCIDIAAENLAMLNVQLRALRADENDH